jgi:hypothetical protein
MKADMRVNLGTIQHPIWTLIWPKSDTAFRPFRDIAPSFADWPLPLSSGFSEVSS